MGLCRVILGEIIVSRKLKENQLRKTQIALQALKKKRGGPQAEDC